MFSKLPCQVFRHQYAEPTPPWQFRQDQQGSCLPSGQGRSAELLGVPQIWPTPPVTGPVGSLGTNRSMTQNQLFPWRKGVWIKKQLPKSRSAGVSCMGWSYAGTNETATITVERKALRTIKATSSGPLYSDRQENIMLLLLESDEQ